MLVSDRHLAGGEDALLAAVDDAIAGGVNAVQLREKDLSPAELLPLAKRLREVTAGRAMMVVNSSVGVALASGADGVHLPEELPTIERPSRPFLVGRSVHSREAAEQAWSVCSDYLIAGLVFVTASHAGAEPGGVQLIESITGVVAVPVLAVGGIDTQRVDDVVRSGASGVAAISAVLGARSAREAARELRGALDAAWAAVKESDR